MSAGTIFSLCFWKIPWSLHIGTIISYFCIFTLYYLLCWCVFFFPPDKLQHYQSCQFSWREPCQHLPPSLVAHNKWLVDRTPCFSGNQCESLLWDQAATFLHMRQYSYLAIPLLFSFLHSPFPENVLSKTHFLKNISHRLCF